MRIATFNILNGRAPSDEQVDEETFAKAIASLDADILGLQEVDRNQPRSQHADLTAVAAEAMAAPEHLFVAALSGTPGATWSAATGEEQPDSAAYGVALLSRYPVLGWHTVRLPAVPFPVPMRFGHSWNITWVRDEPRVAVAAEVDSPQGRLRVVCTHLSFLRWWNSRQLRKVLDAVPRSDEPVVLLGDLNMLPDEAARVSRLMPAVSDPTFPSHAPTEQLDHILVDEAGLTCRGCGAVELPVSDHRALYVDV